MEDSVFKLCYDDKDEILGLECGLTAKITGDAKGGVRVDRTVRPPKKGERIA